MSLVRRATYCYDETTPPQQDGFSDFPAMTEIILNPEYRCHFRDTPWDERSFGFRTRELLSVEREDPSQVAAILAAFEARNAVDRVGLCYARVDANDRVLIHALNDVGYRPVEHSFALSLSSLNHFYPENHFGKNLALRPLAAADVPVVQEIAAHDFLYGRFIEDEMIARAACQRRQRNWVADMVANKDFTIWVHGEEGAPQGFHAFKVQDQHAQMILSGMAAKYQPLAAFFWASCLHEKGRMGIQTVSTMIAAANLPIVNLYARFGFRFDQFLVGLHKHYPQGQKHVHA